MLSECVSIGNPQGEIPCLLIEYRIYGIAVLVIDREAGSVLINFEVAVLLGIEILLIDIVCKKIEIERLPAGQPPLDTGLETHPVEVGVIVAYVVPGFGRIGRIIEMDIVQSVAELD